jgi:type IV secretion system protein VirB1
MLDSCRNLLIGSKILHKNYINVLAITPNKSDALYKAISAYNTGNYHAGMDNGYVMKVVHNALMSSSYLIR